MEAVLARIGTGHFFFLALDLRFGSSIPSSKVVIRLIDSLSLTGAENCSNAISSMELEMSLASYVHITSGNIGSESSIRYTKESHRSLLCICSKKCQSTMVSALSGNS